MNQRFANTLRASVLLFPFLYAATLSGEQRPIADLPKDREVKYSTDVFPVLKKNCFACHNSSRDESGVNLESVDKMRASDVENVLVASKSGESRLFVVSAHIEEPVMPPEDNEVGANPLTPEELALLQRWIDQGAVVDVADPGMVKYEWQPLPDHLRTVYASTMTADGRLAAASFGNEIRIFGASSPEPLASLAIIDEAGNASPPHLDFVQDLAFAEGGRRLVSSGFRNVKIWKLNSPVAHSLPQIDAQATLVTTIDRLGNHVANVSSTGEVKVTTVGMDQWQWSKNFTLPESFKPENATGVLAAVNSDGQGVAVAIDKEIRLVRSDAAEAKSITSEQPIASIAWDRNGRLVTGDTTGGLTFWVVEGDGFKPVTEKIGDKPVAHLIVPVEGASVLMAIDAAGKLASWHAEETKIKETKQLPAPVKHVAAVSDGTALWTTLESGAFGKFDIASGKLTESGKFDPAASDAYAQANWTVLVGERLVAATEAELKTAQDNEAAEKKNLEGSEKDIEAKAKELEAAKKPAEDAKKAEQDAQAALVAEQAKEKEMNAKRVELAAKIKEIDAAVPTITKEKETIAVAVAETAKKMTEMQTQMAAIEAELKKKLDEMKAAVDVVAKQKADQDAKVAALQKKLEEQAAAKAKADADLKAIPAEAALAAEVKKAQDAADKAKKEAEAKAEALKKAQAASELAAETKQRAEARVKESAETVAQRQQLVADEKAHQEERKKQEAAVKEVQDKSPVADKALAVVGDGKFLISQSSAAGRWNLWSVAGDWIATLDDGGELVASSSQTLLVRVGDGTIKAYRLAKPLYTLERTIGSPDGESPFTDRVLTVDIDPSNEHLVTGGGEPSRSGEVKIWNLADGALVREIANPHTDTVLCARFSPDGTMLATSGADRMIKVWDLKTGELMKTLEGHTHHVNSIAWNVNNRQISSASADSSVKIWDVSSGQATRTITGLTGELTRLVYVGRDDRVGFVSGDNYFRVYRTDNGGRETNAKVAEGYLYALASNRDGTLFVLGGADGNAKIVDKTGKETQKYE
ncbi:MAG: c-type cytochrome domain-containing protein [Pirellulaceae bacterium]